MNLNNIFSITNISINILSFLVFLSVQQKIEYLVKCYEIDDKDQLRLMDSIAKHCCNYHIYSDYLFQNILLSGIEFEIDTWRVIYRLDFNRSNILFNEKYITYNIFKEIKKNLKNLIIKFANSKKTPPKSKIINYLKDDLITYMEPYHRYHYINKFIKISIINNRKSR
jgi:hypothetical protein